MSKLTPTDPAAWRIDQDGGLPSVRREAAQSWITWSPSVSAFGIDIPHDELQRQAVAILQALSAVTFTASLSGGEGEGS